MQGRAGVEANARLTAMTGIVLLVLFITEIATVLLGARSVLTLHVTLGLLLVPPVLLKIASTTWRIAAYYRGNTAYREKGPPALALRILGPFLVFLTMLLFVSGIGLIVGPRPLHSSFLIVHKASFYLWLLALVIHVAAHSKTVVRVARKNTARRTRIRTTRAQPPADLDRQPAPRQRSCTHGRAPCGDLLPPLPAQVTRRISDQLARSDFDPLTCSETPARACG